MTSYFGRKPRIAVVGCSWFARAAHLPALKLLSEEGLIEVVALCSRTEESLISARNLIGNNVLLYTDFDEMLSNENIDLVDLVLPTPIIGSAISKSFNAGKHVISEKPCSSTVDDSIRLLKEYDRYSGQLTWSVAENWPFKPSVITIKNILDSKLLGDIESIDFTYKSLGWGTGLQGWRTSDIFKGGYLLDSGVHFISMLRYIIGDIFTVNANVEWHKAAHSANKVTSDIIFSNEIKGIFKVDFTENFNDNELYHLIIKCENGYLKANFVTNKLLIDINNTIQTIDIPNDSWIEGGVYWMLRHCCESLINGSPASCTPVEGLRDVAVIEAMIQSNRLCHPVMPSLLHNQLNGCNYSIKSYGELYKEKPRHLVVAKSIYDIQTTLKEAASNGLKVRTKGFGNNWTKYSLTNDIVIDLTQLDKVKKINKEEKTIEISAGVSMRDLTKSLASYNLCLPSLPFLADATIGGMISTASHGTSPHWGTVSDAVISMKMITSSGNILEIDKYSDPRILKSARVSIGMLGVITELKLQAVDMKWVRNVLIDVRIEEFLELQSTIFKKYEHIWIHWLLGGNRLKVQCLETREHYEDGFIPYVNNDVGNWVMQYHHTAKMDVGTSPIMMSMQYGIPLEKLDHALRLVNSSEFSQKYSGREIELKFLKKMNYHIWVPIQMMMLFYSIHFGQVIEMWQKKYLKILKLL